MYRIEPNGLRWSTMAITTSTTCTNYVIFRMTVCLFYFLHFFAASLSQCAVFVIIKDTKLVTICSMHHMVIWHDFHRRTQGISGSFFAVYCYFRMIFSFSFSLLWTFIKCTLIDWSLFSEFLFSQKISHLLIYPMLCIVADCILYTIVAVVFFLPCTKSIEKYFLLWKW